MLVVILVCWMWLLCWLWLWFVVCVGAVESTVWIVVGCGIVWLCGCVVVALCGCVVVWLWHCGTWSVSARCHRDPCTDSRYGESLADDVEVKSEGNDDQHDH